MKIVTSKKVLGGEGHPSLRQFYISSYDRYSVFCFSSMRVGKVYQNPHVTICIY
jgi:hypothetical protein